MTARATPHVIRLSMIDALTECSPVVKLRHLEAAPAVRDYSVRSVRYLFGESTGNAVADDILALLKACPNGITRTDVNNYFGRNLPAARLKGALDELLKAGRARVELNCDTGGRAAAATRRLPGRNPVTDGAGRSKSVPLDEPPLGIDDGNDLPPHRAPPRPAVGGSRHEGRPRRRPVAGSDHAE